MRITSGVHGGRILKVPRGRKVRPATDKVRQAVFNMLLSYDLPQDAKVLDVFCGTGAYGLEALSRGASHCVFMDSDITTCRDNIETLKLESSSQILRADALMPPPRTPKMEPVNLVFMDPPYEQGFLSPALDHFMAGGWFAPNCIIVMEMAKDGDDLPPRNIDILKNKDYGDTRIVIAKPAA